MNRNAQKRWEKEIDKYDLPHLRLRQIATIIKEINPSTYTDLGCAQATLRTLTPGINYKGCDFAKPEGDYDYEYYRCDFNTESFPSEIDNEPLIVCSGLLEYIEDIDKFLQQVNMALIDEGILVVSYFNMNHISRIVKLLKGKSFPVHPDWRGFYSPSSFQEKIRGAGFAIRKIVPVSHGFGESKGVDNTIQDELVLPRNRSYSYLLAHQLIFICKKIVL